jgi:hypothetical protein
MRRPTRWLALALFLTLAATARADDLGGADLAAPASSSFALVRDQLRVQIRRESEPRAPGAISRPDLLDTRTVLMRLPALGAEPVDVTVVEAAPWGLTPDELIAIGLDNLERREPPKFRQTPKLERGVQVSLLYGEHPFAAAYALSVARYPTCVGNKGALVAVPTRHATLCYPIESSRAFHAYLALVSMTTQLQVDGENPIVPHVYWFHDGVFEAQPVRIEGTRVEPQPSERFRELLRSLPRDIHDPYPRRW